MASNREQTLRHREIAIGQRAATEILRGNATANVVPDRNAFCESAALVESPVETQRQCRIHVKMRIYERRRDVVSGGLDLQRRFPRQRRFEGDENTTLDANVYV